MVPVGIFSPGRSSKSAKERRSAGGLCASRVGAALEGGDGEVRHDVMHCGQLGGGVPCLGTLSYIAVGLHLES